MDMEMIWYIITIVIALVIGLGIYYLYQKFDANRVDEVFGTVKGIWDRYGERIKQDDPELYDEVDGAMKVLTDAMTDEEISILEAYFIAKSFLPLTKRLTDFVRTHYGC